MTHGLNPLNLLSEEGHNPGDLNINLYQNDSILGQENKNIIKDEIKYLPRQKNI